ncbi:tyrosine-type recombinase/integrase [Thiolapillus sp.]|uniref:tyrosine-type recombinase/integrase n=8 Tax=Thiolapillus sp. TaxID=2017437 RepID=UPI003AF7CC62
MTNLPVAKDGKLPPPPRLSKAERDKRLQETLDAIHDFLDAHKTDNSERAYYAGLRYFWAWCWYTWGVTEEEYPVPEPLIEAYVIGMLKGFRKDTDEAIRELGIKKTPGPSKLSTIEQRLWVLNRAHQEHVKDIDDRYVYTATVRKLLKAARKDGKHRKEKSKALVRDQLLELIDALDDMPPVYGAMMRAMLAVGFVAGGRRVSELVAITPDDLTRRDTKESPGWMFELALGARKTADAADDVKILPIRGFAAVWLMEWLRLREELGVSGPPLFRAVRLRQGRDRKTRQMETREYVQKGGSTSWFWQQIRKLADKAGIEGKITPHSLRSGFATQAVRDGVNVKQVMAMTDHKSVKVFMGYVEAEDLLTSDAGKLL